MERYASSLKMKEIKRLAQGKEYLKAMKILDTLNVDKIRSMADLSVIAEVLVCNEQYEDAREILLRIYEKSCTRRIVEQLTTLSLKMRNMEEAKEFFNEYLRIAPRDPYRLVLRYKIEKVTHVPYAQRIDTLMQLKQEDYMEEWAYELAKLYHKTGQVDKCVEECSDIILWFGQGIIVEKAKLLKEHYTNGFDITDQLSSAEFDATRSLDEVIKQVKRLQRPNVSSPIDIDSTVSASNQFDTDAMYLKSVKVMNEDLQTDMIREPELNEEDDTTLDMSQTQDANEIQEENQIEAVYETQQVDQIQEESETQEENQIQEVNEIQEVDRNQDIDSAQTENTIYEDAKFVLTPEIVQQVRAQVEAQAEEVEVKEKAEVEVEVKAETEVEEKAETEVEAQTETQLVSEQSHHTLSEDELQRMKEKMQQLQDNDVIKTYNHESEDIVEEEDGTYAFGIKLNTIFQNFIENESIKNQLFSILKNMDSSRKCNNFMICGDMHTGKTSLARAIAITMWKLNRIPTKKVAKISASKLNSINLLEKMEQLEDGSLVIENASLLEPTTVEAVIKMIEHFDGRIFVLLEDRTRNMEELMSKEQGLRGYFTHRIIIPRYTAKDIMGFALTMASQQDYTVDDGALEILYEKIEQICRVTAGPEQLSKVKEFVAEAVKKAETRNMLVLMKQAKEGRFSQNVMNKIISEDICNN